MQPYLKNVIIIIILFSCQPLLGQNLKKQFEKEIEQCLEAIKTNEKVLISGEETDHLPDIVRKYLYRTEFVGKERVHNMKVTFEGKIRSKPGGPWMKSTAYQISFFDKPTRLFYFKTNKMLIPINGLNRFKNGRVGNKGNFLGRFIFSEVEVDLMDRAERVSFLNDICLMAPGRLIDNNIRWEEIDPLTVRAFYTFDGITISATLIFNSDGYLVNFISNDRNILLGQDNPKKQAYSTPIVYYMECRDVLIPQTAQTVYYSPEAEFVCSEFTIKSIEYNTSNGSFKN